MKVIGLLSMLWLMGQISCSGGQKLTTAKFNLYLGAMANSLDHQKYQGGVILFAKSVDLNNASFAERIAPTVNGDVAINLPNGQWNFYVMAWSGVVGSGTVGGGNTNAGDMQGTVYCALDLQRQLGGRPVEIQLTMSNSGCAHPEFSSQYFTGSDNMVHFPKLKMTSCNSLSDVSFNAASGVVTSCAPLKAGMAQSYRLKILAFRSQPKLDEIFPILGGHLVSPCLQVNSATPGATLPAQLLNIPDGNGLLPLPTVVEAFYDSSCQNPAQVVVFEEGLHSFLTKPKNNIKYLPTLSGTTPLREIFFTASAQQLCDNADPQRTTFPVGDGVIVPYGICGVQDLDRISDHLDKKFRLLRNIDIDERYAPGQFAMDQIPCSQDQGMNFMPIGRLAEESNGTCSLVDVGYDFIGEFDGGGFFIKNLRIFSQEAEGVGFFRRLGTGAKVKNLRFINADVAGNRRLGVLAGEMANDESTSTTVIENIIIEKAMVRRDGWENGTPQPTYVGGLVGRVEGTGPNIITGVSIKQLEINGSGKDFGGIVGASLGKLQIERSAIEGTIRIYDSNSNVGGIMGSASVETVIAQCFSDGSLHSDGMTAFNYGGVVGFNEGAIRQNISKMVIVNNNAPASLSSVGGIAGYSMGGGSLVEKNIFYGLLVNQCIMSCSIGEVVGTAGANVTNNFVVRSNNLGPSEWYGERGGQIPANYATSVSYFNSTLKGPLGDSTFNTATGIWKMAEGFFPVPRYYDHECLAANNLATISNQVTVSGRGANATNPVVICTSGQFGEIKTFADRFFRLAVSLPKIEITGANAVTSFSGNFEGGNNYLAGIDTIVDNISGFGMFRYISSSGVVKNLRLLGHRVTIQGTSTNVGILAGINQGTIQNVSLASSHLYGGPTVSNGGQIAGTNTSTGKILNSAVASGSVRGLANLGAVVGVNQGLISLTRAQGHLEGAFSTVVNGLGGLVGRNEVTGIISRCDATSYLYLLDGGSAIGGLVGNNLGKIENSSTSSQQQIRLMASAAPTYEKVGGMVGYNYGASAIINRSYAGGKIWISDIATYSGVGGLVGMQDAGALSSGQSFFAYPPVKHQMSFPQIMYQRYDGGTSLPNCQDVGAGVVALGGFSMLTSNPDVAAGRHLSPNDEMRDLVLTIVSKTDDVITVSGSTCEKINGYGDPNMNYLEFKSIEGLVAANSIGALASLTSVEQLSYYCADTLPAPHSDQARNFKCTNGWDIVSMDGEYGLNRLFAYFEAETKGLPFPADMPIWEMKDGDDGLPRLLGMRY